MCDKFMALEWMCISFGKNEHRARYVSFLFIDDETCCTSGVFFSFSSGFGKLLTGLKGV